VGFAEVGMLKRRDWTGVAALVALLAARATLAEDVWDAVGDDGSCTTNVELVHGAIQRHDLQAFSGIIPDTDFALVQQRAHRSYEVRVSNSAIRLAELTPPARVDCAGNVVTAGAPYENVARDAVSIRWRATADGSTYIRTGGFLAGPSSLYDIQMLETTYSVPRFNNSATQQTVLVVQNLRASSVSGGIAFFGAGGGAPVLTQPFTLAAHALLVLNTSSLPPVAGTSGSILVAHDGGYGALAGKAVALESATGFTFDTQFDAKPY
jgi:hypothetical protein